jgi:acyl carrier protein
LSIGDDLSRVVESWNLRMPNQWDGNTSLIRSGILDSLALYQLILWIEEQTGKPVDPTQFDLASELDSITDILRFVERNRIS